MEDLPLELFLNIYSYLRPNDIRKLKNTSNSMKEILRSLEGIPDENVELNFTNDPYQLELNFENESQGSFQILVQVYPGGVAMNFYEEQFQRGYVLLDSIPNFLKAIYQNGSEELFFDQGTTKGVFQNPNYFHLKLENNKIKVEIVNQFMDDEDNLQKSITTLPDMFTDQWVDALIQLQEYIISLRS